jgi:orotate phosphoribosyltransferase
MGGAIRNLQSKMEKIVFPSGFTVTGIPVKTITAPVIIEVKNIMEMYKIKPTTIGATQTFEVMHQIKGETVVIVYDNQLIDFAQSILLNQ